MSINTPSEATEHKEGPSAMEKLSNEVKFLQTNSTSLEKYSDADINKELDLLLHTKEEAEKETTQQAKAQIDALKPSQEA